jgi:TPR repeat protein
MDDEFLHADAAYERGDFKEAFDRFLKLAESGDLGGMERVACMYGDGEGTLRNRDKSLEWDLKAAALGSTTSMFNLGITLRNSGDARGARRWFEALHAAGDGDASLELAKMYMISDLEGGRIKAYLLATVQSSNVCEASREEAQQLLDQSNDLRL